MTVWHLGVGLAPPIVTVAVAIALIVWSIMAKVGP